MGVRLAFVVLAAASLPGCASLPSSRDDLCAPLLAFARSVGPGEERDVVFHTSWGSNFRDDPEPAIFATRCAHGGYDPAKAVCEFLVEHGAIEFAGRNVQRALSCLAPGTHFGPGVSLERGVFQLGFGTPHRGSHIAVEFLEDETLGGMVLRIHVDGY